jgi:hypothetical protein
MTDATTFVNFSFAVSVELSSDCTWEPRHDDTADEPAIVAAWFASPGESKIWTCDPTSRPVVPSRKFEEMATVAGVGAFDCFATQLLSAERTTFLPPVLDSLFHEDGKAAPVRFSSWAAKFCVGVPVPDGWPVGVLPPEEHAAKRRPDEATTMSPARRPPPRSALT